MGTVLEKANKIKETKNKLKEAINDGGGQITNNTVFNDYANEIKDIYIDAISDGVDNLYNNFPKVTGEGSEIILDTEEAPMKITLEGDTSQKTSVLPEEYTQVEYIESTGTQYINTGVDADDINYSFDIDFYGYETQPTTYHRNFGYQRNGGIFLGNKFWYGNNTNINCTDDLGTFNDERHSVFANKDYAIVDNVKYNLNTPPTDFIKNTSTKIAIFGAFDGGDGAIRNDSLSKIKLYSFKIYHNNNLIRNFIPAIRNSDNEVGLYDIVNNTFYINQGTGVFTYGSVIQIPNPDYPQDIKVVTGEQNTNIRSKNLFNAFNLTNETIEADGTIVLKNVVSSNGYHQTYKKLSYLCPSLKVGDKVYLYIQSDWTSRKYIYSNSLGNWSNKQSRTITQAMLNDTIVLYGGYNTTSHIKIMVTKELDINYLPYYIPQVYPLSLDNIELAKIGNYKDYIFKNVTDSSYYNAELDLNEWYLHKEINKVVLDGSENWVSETAYTGYYRFNASDILPPFTRGNNGLNNRFTQRVDQPHGDYQYLYLQSNNGNIHIQILQSLLTNGNASTFKNWLLNNNTIVYYVLSIPTNTKITDTTLIQQLENINNNARSYLGTTVIECSATDNTNEAIQASIIALKNINLIESE